MGSGDPCDPPLHPVNMTALVDCNSFYASCEKVFRPDLRNRPVVVLSNNDGCIVAMSPEAKKLDIPRGAPFFKVQQRLDAAGAEVFSSNYTLYDDLSRRIMDILHSYTPHLEVYSIDEGFLDLRGDREFLLQQATQIRTRVEQWVGIAVSVGIGRTKTLAKIANSWAKKREDGICMPTDEDWPRLLARTDVRDIWGVGQQYAHMLHSNAVHTAADLKACDEIWVKKRMTLVGLKTLWELNGKPSFTMEEVPPSKKGIISSRSFGKAVTEKEDILEAGANYASQAAEKMRSQKSVCRVIHTSITTNYFREGDRQYARGITEELPHPVSYTPQIVAVVRRQLEELFRPGFRYKKITVFLTEIEAAGQKQLNLFYQEDARHAAVMEAVDRINSRYGRQTLHCQPKRPGSNWQMKREKLSPCYTTRWKEIPLVKTG
ncbi:MAG: hypothetical protein B6241_14545 [Spirochaetaceae bacterium 4572_59]|nr:MAG: hypothetical protein B6241_14545 [Spirochaetaceae bacterium 4572_59]